MGSQRVRHDWATFTFAWCLLTGVHRCHREMTVECGGAERRLPEPWEHRGEVHSDVGGQRCSEVMGEKRENSQLGRRSMCSGLDVRSSLLGKGGEAVRREGEDLGEINRSQVVRALYAEVGAEAGVGSRLGLSIRCKCPPNTSDLSHRCLFGKKWHPTPVLLPGKSHGRRSLVGCSPWGRQESDTTEWLHFHFSLSCIGEGNGNPLQCSCLENPRDGGAWWEAVYGVTQSRTRLKRLSSSSSRRAPWFILLGLEEEHCALKRASQPVTSPSRFCHSQSFHWELGCRPAMNSLVYGTWSLHGVRKLCWGFTLGLSELLILEIARAEE